MSAAEFAAAYVPADEPRVAFAWNGQHGDGFTDANQQFRSEVIDWCLAHPRAASPVLLGALLQADAAWAVQAWAVPDRFPRLAEALLSHPQSGPEELDAFIAAAQCSFDCYCSCYELKLSSELLVSLSAGVAMRLANTLDEDEQKRFKHIVALFHELREGTAVKHLEKLPDLPKPSLWGRLKGLFKS